MILPHCKPPTANCQLRFAMSKKVKNLVTMELKKRLGELDGVAVISPRGISATKNHGIRRRLHEQGLKMTVVRKTLGRRATTGTRVAGVDARLDGPKAGRYG